MLVFSSRERILSLALKNNAMVQLSFHNVFPLLSVIQIEKGFTLHKQELKW